jgi:hypothetical protein
MIVFVAALVLQVHVADGHALRLAAVGIADDDVTWLVDGAVVGTTHADEALDVEAVPGEHVVEARTSWQGAWSIAARAMPATADEVEYVETDQAFHAATEPFVIPGPGIATVLGILLVVGGRRASKGP